MAYNNYSFPRQKLPTSKKTKKWGKENVDAGEDMALYGDEGLRQSFYNKKINYNLYSDILDQSDVENVVNPHGIKNFSAPAKMQNYPIANPKSQQLLGEEMKRNFEFTVRITNEDAISQKEEEKSNQLKRAIIEEVKNEDNNEEEIKKRLRDLKKYFDLKYQDARERRATHILKYLSKTLDLEKIFNDGFKDALIAGEEIYQCDIIAGEPVMKRINPLNIYTIRSGESNRIEDSDIIIINSYMAPGMVIDEYHEELTSKEIDQIEEGHISGSGNSGLDIGEQYGNIMLDDVIDTSRFHAGENFGDSIDEQGNIRVLKVYWRSLRKIKKLKYFDKFGDPQYEIVDEYYKPHEELGESIEATYWVNEWWEGHKIGGGQEGNEGIYVKIQPRPIQFRKVENPSYCHPGIVGTAYNTNTNKAISLMDRMKPYQYLYNVLMYRTELAFAKSHGKIMRLPLHEIPENWEIDKWLNYAYSMNLAPVDLFREGNKGSSQGKLAGHMNQNDHIIDMEMGNYIQQHLSMLEYIEQQMGVIAGISQQRQGQISPREAVGNAQQAIVQSSHTTEYYFKEHEGTRLRALECLLETAKHAWRGQSKKIQYVLDDMSTELFEIDGDELIEQEFGIYISDSKRDDELIQNLKELAHAGVQNDKLDFSQLMDIYTTESIATIKDKIEDAEEENKEERQQNLKQKKEEIQKEKDLEQRNKMMDFKMDKYKEDLEAAVDREKMVNDRYIALIKENNNASNEDLKNLEDSNQKLEELRQKKEEMEQDMQVKQRELDLEEEQNDIEKKKVEAQKASNNKN